MTDGPTRTTDTSIDNDTAPAWFAQAVATTPARDVLIVEDARINVSSWGERGAPGLVLVHGAAAHAQWWSFIAPQLAAGGYHVAALDLSGHGDSGHRDRYAFDLWTAELLAVIEAMGMDRPVLIGHSLGGYVVTSFAARWSDRIAGAVVADSPFADMSEIAASKAVGSDNPVAAFGRQSVYASADEAMERFRLYPPQPCGEFIVRHIARASLGPTDGGWTWKFDRRIFDSLDFGEPMTALGAVTGPLAFIHGEASPLIAPAQRRRMTSLLGREIPYIEIPEANHHLMLDQPLAFVVALRAVLETWTHSEPDANAIRDARCATNEP